MSSQLGTFHFIRRYQVVRQTGALCDPLYAARRMYFITIRYTTSYGLTGRSPLRNTKFELLTYLKQSKPCSGRDNLPVQITPQKKELQIKWHKKPRGKNKNNTRRETPQKVCLVAKQTKHAVGLNITEKMPILLTTVICPEVSEPVRNCPNSNAL